MSSNFKIMKKIFPFLIIPIIYIPILCVKTIIDHTSGLFIGLTILSTCTTFTFEQNEWNIYFKTYRKQKLDVINYFKPLLEVFIEFCAITSIVILLVKYRLLSKSFLF